MTKTQHQEIDLSARFWNRTEVRKPNECWPWTGTITKKGYGTLEILGKAVVAHRLSYEVNSGKPVPAGLVVDHKCCNKACVNPAHLEAVTHSVNCRRRDNNCVRKVRKTKEK